MQLVALPPEDVLLIGHIIQRLPTRKKSSIHSTGEREREREREREKEKVREIERERERGGDGERKSISTITIILNFAVLKFRA